MAVIPVSNVSQFNTAVTSTAGAGDTIQLQDAGTFSSDLIVPASAPANLTITTQSYRGVNIPRMRIQRNATVFQNLSIQMVGDPASASIDDLFCIETNNIDGTVLDGCKIRAGYFPGGYANFNPRESAAAGYAAYIGDLTVVPQIVSATNPLLDYPWCIRVQSGFSYPTGDLVVENCEFSDTARLVSLNSAGGANWKFRKNRFLRAYCDALVIGFPSGAFTPIELLEITGNEWIDNAWCKPEDNENPHGDMIQIFSQDSVVTPSLTPIQNLFIAGNLAWFTPGYRGSSQRTFLSDIPTLYPFVGTVSVDNLMLSLLSAKGVYINAGESPSVNLGGAAYCYSFRDAPLTIPTQNVVTGNGLYTHPLTGKGPSSVNVSAIDINQVSTSGYAGKNFCGSALCERVTSDPYLDKTLFPNIEMGIGSSANRYSTAYNQPADWDTLDTADKIVTAFTPKTLYQDYGPVRAGQTAAQFLDKWSGDIKPYDELPSYVGWAAARNVPASTLTTSEYGYIHAGFGTRTITPGSGVQWSQANTAAGSGATAFTSSPGTLTHGKFLAIRAISPANGTATYTVTVGDTVLPWRITTESSVTYPTVVFDGSTKLAQQVAHALGTNGSLGTIAVRFKKATHVITETWFGSHTGTSRVTFQMLSTGKLRLALRGVGGTLLCQVDSTSVLADGNWHDVQISWDVSQTASADGLTFIVDGAAGGASPTTWAGGPGVVVDYATSLRRSYGGSSTPTMTAEHAMFYANWTERADLTNADVLDSFSAALVGPNGQGPTGSVPDFFLVGEAADFNAGAGINLGTAFPLVLTNGSLTNGTVADWPPVLTVTASTLTLPPYALGLPIDIQVGTDGYGSEFTVTADASLNGSWTTNPDDVPAGADPITMTFTPSQGGDGTITFAADNGYNDATPLSLTVEGVSPTTYTQALSVGPYVPAPTSIDITYVLDQPATQNVTIVCACTLAGTFPYTNQIVIGVGQTVGTLTFVPTEYGTAIFTATNDRSLTDPSPVQVVITSTNAAQLVKLGIRPSGSSP